MTIDPTPRAPGRVLILLAVAQLMVVLDVTVVNVALPSAQQSLSFSPASREWVVTAYALTFGSLLLLGGRVGRSLGPRRAVVIGLCGFATASAVGGAAQSFAMLLAGRAAQGVFAALLAPAVLSSLATTFSSSPERARAFGIFGAVATSGASVGLLLGGALTDLLSWRWPLWINLAIALPAALAARRLLPDTRTDREPLDLPGALLAIAGLFSLIYGVANAQRASWSDSVTIATLAAAVLLLGGFAVTEARARVPLLPLRIPADRARGGAYLAIGFNSLGLFGAFLFLTYYLQRVKGLSPLMCGVAFLPTAVCISVTAITVNTRLLPVTGPRRLLATAPLLGAAAMAWLAQLDAGSSYAAGVLPGMVLLGIAAGATVSPAIATATHGVDQADAGVAAALVSTMQQVGGSIGLAVLSTIAAAGATFVDGFTTAFWVAAGTYALAALICGAVVPSLPPRGA